MTSGTGGPPIRVPDALAASLGKFFGDAGRAWVRGLPGLAAACLDRWALRVDGAPICGAVALVLPVRRGDGTAAVLKLQPVDEETVGEPLALRTWGGDGAVRLLEHDTGSGALLLERLDAGRSLAMVPDDLAALRILRERLARLTAVPAPPGIRHLSGVAAAMLDRVPGALAVVSDPALRRLVRACAAAVAELLPEAGDRLLHWDLHFHNVLARPGGPDAAGPDAMNPDAASPDAVNPDAVNPKTAGSDAAGPDAMNPDAAGSGRDAVGRDAVGRDAVCRDAVGRDAACRAGGRGEWLAIDPKPVAGDPGFELLAALHNRWDDVVATGNVTRAVLVRFDLMTEVLGLDRRRAAGWTLGRVLENALWEAEKQDTTWHTGPDRAIATALSNRYRLAVT